MIVTDKYKIGERFWKNKETYKQQASVQKILCECFASILFSYDFKVNSILEIGCGTGFLTEEILKHLKPEVYIANDISKQMEEEISWIAKAYNYSHLHFISGDAETIEFPQKTDCIISTSTIQWFYNLPEFFTKVYNNLHDSGIFACSTFGPQNFIEIRETLDKGLEYKTAEEIRAYLEPNFTIIDCIEWTEVLEFANPMEVIKHMKQTGVSGFGGRYFGKERLQKFVIDYDAKYSTNKAVTLTYNPIMFFAKKK